MPLDLKNVEATFDAFRRKLNRAIRLSSPNDIDAIQQLSTGVSALTKALATLDRVKSAAAERAQSHSDFYYDET